jgi:hypothetical protein
MYVWSRELHCLCWNDWLWLVEGPGAAGDSIMPLDQMTDNEYEGVGDDRTMKKHMQVSRVMVPKFSFIVVVVVVIVNSALQNDKICLGGVDNDHCCFHGSSKTEVTFLARSVVSNARNLARN